MRSFPPYRTKGPTHRAPPSILSLHRPMSPCRHPPPQSEQKAKLPPKQNGPGEPGPSAGLSLHEARPPRHEGRRPTLPGDLAQLGMHSPSYRHGRRPIPPHTARVRHVRPAFAVLPNVLPFDLLRHAPHVGRPMHLAGRPRHWHGLHDPQFRRPEHVVALPHDGLPATRHRAYSRLADASIPRPQPLMEANIRRTPHFVSQSPTSRRIRGTRARALHKSCQYFPLYPIRHPIEKSAPRATFQNARKLSTQTT